MEGSNYIIVESWMISKLGMRGNKLLLFALIYGFSRDGKSEYRGSLRYIMKALGLSKPTVISLKESLKKQDFIIEIPNPTGNKFKANLGVISTIQGGKVSLPLSSKVSLPLSGKETLPNKYNNIYISTTTEKLQKNIILLELLAMQNHVKITTIKSKISEFVKHSISLQKEYQRDSDLFGHFGNWIRSQKLKDIDLDNEFELFIKMYNDIAKKQFVGTKIIKELFVNAIENGFTGKQMYEAIVNLYSSSDKNKWHKNNNWEFATPEHLLKADNLNKYLNVNR